MISEKEKFYTKVAEILDTPYEFQPLFRHRRRWGPRQPGNGRFPEFGLIRWFSSKFIHVSLTAPVNLSKTFSSEEDAFTFLKEKAKEF